jgi:hypothetical protein
MANQEGQLSNKSVEYLVAAIHTVIFSGYFIHVIDDGLFLCKNH